MAFIFKWSLLLLILSGCTSLVYYPDKYLHAHPDQFGVKFENLKLSSIDGTQLSAWRLLSKKERPKNLLLYFHGNAQNLTAHFVNAAWMTDYDYDVIIFDYQGYGLSEGSPSPLNLANDGLALLNYAYEQYKVGKFEKLIIYTQSLGGAVALKSLEDFKHRDEIALLVFDSTFLSPRDVAREKTNRLFSKLISNDAVADPKLSHLTMPVLSIHAHGDKVIAYELGKDLYERINSSPKKEFWSLETNSHGDVFFIEENKYRELFIDFVKKLARPL